MLRISYGNTFSRPLRRPHDELSGSASEGGAAVDKQELMVGNVERSSVVRDATRVKLSAFFDLSDLTHKESPKGKYIAFQRLYE